jgi:hypothetical protein
MRIGFDAKRAFLNASGLGYYSRNTINALYHYSKNNQYVLIRRKVHWLKYLNRFGGVILQNV